MANPNYYRDTSNTMALDIGRGSLLFWSAKSGLSPGTLVKPGNFQDHLIRQTLIEVQTSPLTVTIPDAASTGSVLLEVAWETVRLREFPYRPSRFDCLFLWTDERVARRFNSKRADTELYEVEIVDCSRVFAANMDLISYFEESETLGSMFERAREYWRTERKDEHREILLEGSIRIAQTIS